MTDKVREASRPSPDALLRDAAREGKGRLKIFLGAAPGVGKTYEMLQVAAERLRDGHRRRRSAWSRRTAAPRPRRWSRGSRSCRAARSTIAAALLREMDLDAVLARSPALALVDELAHTQVPGMPPSQALAGRRRADRRRHRRLHHAQRPACREPHRRGGELHQACACARPCPTACSNMPRSRWSISRPTS